MFKNLSLYASLAVLSIGSLAAANYDPSNGQWRVIGEYLYWAPSVDDTYFVIDSAVSTIFPNGKRKNNDLNFHSGYRIGGDYLFCDCNRALQVTYTNLNFKQNKTVTGDFLWATNGTETLTGIFRNYSGSAESHLKFQYQNLDAFYAQELFDCCGLDFGIQLGFEAVELKLNETDTYSAAAETGFVHQHSKTNGIGPKIGFSVGYNLFESKDCDCSSTLSLNFLTAGSLLAADTKTHIDASLGTSDGTTSILDVSNKKDWRVVPALHARVGLNYDMVFSCVEASLEVGYEFTSFLRGLTRTSFPDSESGVTGMSFTNFYNFDMQGLYVSGSVTF